MALSPAVFEAIMAGGRLGLAWLTRDDRAALDQIRLWSDEINRAIQEDPALDPSMKGVLRQQINDISRAEAERSRDLATSRSEAGRPT